LRREEALTVRRGRYHSLKSPLWFVRFDHVARLGIGGCRILIFAGSLVCSLCGISRTEEQLTSTRDVFPRNQVIQTNQFFFLAL
jgi:hypothetical protein